MYISPIYSYQQWMIKLCRILTFFVIFGTDIFFENIFPSNSTIFSMKWKKRFFNRSCSFNQKSLLEKQKMIRNSTHYVWQYFIFNVHIYYTCSPFKVFHVNLNAKEGKNEILLSCYLRPKKVWSPFSFRSLAYIFVAHFLSDILLKYSLVLNCA